MEQLIGYTLQDDIEEFERDGFIRVRNSPKGDCNKKVHFSKDAIYEGNPTSTRDEDLEDFSHGYFIMITDFTQGDKS